MFKSKYYILKLIEAAGGKVSGRKRLQKLTHIMKSLSYPMPLHFSYHRYGPYSPELSVTVSELSSLGLLKEKYKKQSYEYEITKKGKSFLKLLEKNKLIQKYDMPDKLKKAAKSILQRDPSLLEIVSTILFLMEYGESYKKSCKEAIELKPHLKGYIENAKSMINDFENM